MIFDIIITLRLRHLLPPVIITPRHNTSTHFSFYQLRRCRFRLAQKISPLNTAANNDLKTHFAFNY